MDAKNWILKLSSSIFIFNDHLFSTAPGVFQNYDDCVLVNS